MTPKHDMASMPPMQPQDELSYRVRSGNGVNELRGFFDRMLWSGKTVVPQWSDLYEALKRQDQPVVRLLVTWGARPGDADLDRLKKDLNSAELSEVMTMLRRGGYRFSTAATAASADFSQAQAKSAAAIPGLTKKADISQLPQEWLAMLDKVQRSGLACAVIAGGALRDSLNGAPVKDVDIFISAFGDKMQHHKYIQQALQSMFPGVPQYIKGCPSRYSTMRPQEFMNPNKGGFRTTSMRGETHEAPSESWSVVIGPHKTEYNFVFVNTGGGKTTANHHNFGVAITDLFDMDICQVFTDGKRLGTSTGYDRAVETKSIGLIKRNFTSIEHLQRLKAKYPDWKMDPQAQKMIDDHKNKASRHNRPGSYY